MLIFKKKVQSYAQYDILHFLVINLIEKSQFTYKNKNV